MNNILKKSAIEKAVAEAVNEYLKLKASDQEYENDVSFWSVNKKTNTEQEAGNDSNDGTT